MLKHLRLSLLGFGVVGQGLAELLATKKTLLEQQYGLRPLLVSVANARHGFLYREDGLDIPTLLELAAAGRPLTEHPGITHWDSALAGLRATGGDVLAEVTGTNLRDAEPGISHIRTALSQGMSVITANKGPGALAAKELFVLAHQRGVQLRMEATVMAGTPVLSTIREGMAGGQGGGPRGIPKRGTKYIFSAEATRRGDTETLAEGHAPGDAGADPTTHR